MKNLILGWGNFVVYFKLFPTFRTLFAIAIGVILSSCEPANPISAPSSAAIQLVKFQAFADDVNQKCGSLTQADIERLEKIYAAHLYTLDKYDLSNDELLKKTQIRLAYLVCRSKFEIGVSSNSWLDYIEENLLQSSSGNPASSSIKTWDHEN